MQQILSHALLVLVVIYPVIVRWLRVQNNFPLKNCKLYKPYRALFQDSNSHHYNCHTVFTAVTVFF